MSTQLGSFALKLTALFLLMFPSVFPSLCSLCLCGKMDLTMNPRNLGILAVVTAAVAALAAVAVYRQQAAVAPKVETGVVLPALGAKVNDIATIEVKTGDKSLTVHRDPAKADAPWTVKELGDYPAKFEKVKETIVGLSMLEKVEPRTDRPESYDKISVQEPAPGNEAKLVTVSAAGSPVASLIVGKSTFAGSKQQVYVREPGQARSWLAEGDLTITPEPMDWVDKQVLTIDSARIQMAIINHADGAQLVVSRGSKDTPYEVADMPEGRELKNTTVANPVASALAFVNMEAVKPAAEVDWEGASSSEYRTFDGLMLTATTVEREGEVWAKFSADFEESLVLPVPIAQPADGHEMTAEETAAAQKTADDQRAATIERVRKEMETLNAKLAPWAFKIPKTKADQMRRKLEDLLKEAPLPEPTPAVEPEGEEPDFMDPGMEEPQDPAEEPALPPPGEPEAPKPDEPQR
jgi:hypothetical protein